MEREKLATILCILIWKQILLNSLGLISEQNCSGLHCMAYNANEQIYTLEEAVDTLLKQ